MGEIKISVIIPIYNKEKYIKKCLISIINQTFKNIEIILIDDGSTDKSYEEIKIYINRNIIYKKIKNSGVSIARNEGIKLSKGKYLIFIDADDFIDEFMLEKLYEKIEYLDIDLVMCGMHEIFENEKKIQITNKKEIIKMNLYEYKELLKINPILFHSCGNKLFRKDIIENNNIYFFKNSHSYEDYNFVLKYLTFVKQIFLIKDCHYYYYRNNDSVTKNKKKYKNIQELFLKLLEIYKTFKDIEGFNLQNKNEVVKKIFIEKIKTYKIHEMGIKSLQNIYIKDKNVDFKDVELYSEKLSEKYMMVGIINKKLKFRFYLFKKFRYYLIYLYQIISKDK